MLGKLAYRNTKRNIKDYLIYLITVTASFSLIFAFNLVASSDEIVKLCSSMDAFKNSLFAVNILIIFVICFLINYTTKFATVYKGNIIKNLIMDCQSYTKYRPNETTGGIFVSWRRKEELPTGA